MNEWVICERIKSEWMKEWRESSWVSSDDSSMEIGWIMFYKTWFTLILTKFSSKTISCGNKDKDCVNEWMNDEWMNEEWMNGWLRYYLT